MRHAPIATPSIAFFHRRRFVEFNSVNHLALTYGRCGTAHAERYKVWELSSYTPVLSLPDTGVVDIK